MIRRDQALKFTAAVAVSALVACGGGGGSATPTLTSQAITFGQPSAQTSGSTYSLTATASSNLQVTFTSSSPTVCTVSGSTLSLLAPGNCVVEARQDGNSTYSAAGPVSRTIVVNPVTLVFSSGYTNFRETAPGSNYYEGGTAQGGKIGFFSGNFENYDNTYTGGGYSDSASPVPEQDTYFYIAITTRAPSSDGYMGMYVTSPTGGLRLSGQTTLNVKVGVSQFHFAQQTNKDFKVDIEALGSGNCNPIISKVVTPTSSDLTSYQLTLSSFSVSQNCGNAALTVANVLALPINAVNTLFAAPNINNTVRDGAVYPTGITRGMTSFQ